MKIAFLLHFYQPHDQQDDILNRIVNESYRPLIKGLLERPRAKIVVNITGALTKLLDEKGYSDVLDGLKTLSERGQIELTGSCMYHSFLPLIPESEALRQVQLNDEANQRIQSKSTKPVGFFSPEMAISQKVLSLVEKQGYKWLAASEVARADGVVTADKLYTRNGLKIFFRNKRVSSLILSSVIRDAKSLIRETKDLHQSDKFWFCVMDAETFGHHRIGLEKVLFDILDDDFFEPVTVSDLLNSQEQFVTEEASLRDCTWTNSEQDFHLKKNQNSFILWRDPENPIHKMQWKLTDLVVESVENYKNKEEQGYKQARALLDMAIASDQFWWASVKPWWSLEMIEQGAHNLKHVASVLDPNGAISKKAEKLYRGILDQAFEWQRSGYIRNKHLENSATYMKEPFKTRTPAEWYNQIILEFEDEMKKAGEKREFEKAIKWRDAIIKLEQGTDIYDVLHVVDELWSARQIPSVKPFLNHNWDELSEFAKKHLQDVMTAEDLENWKKQKETKFGVT